MGSNEDFEELLKKYLFLFVSSKKKKKKKKKKKNLIKLDIRNHSDTRHENVYG
jgi:hypothetical protein